MSDWIYRYYLLVPTSSKDLANQLATSIAPGGQLEANTFSIVKLSADGQLPETYYACSTLATENMKVALNNVLLTYPEIPFIWYRVDSITQIIMASSSQSQTVLDAISGSLVWTWQDVLNDLSLQMIIEA